MIEFGDLIGSAAFAIFLVWMFWAAFRRKSLGRPVPDEPVGKPYKVYTTEFDVVLRGRDVADRLKALSRDYANGHFQTVRDAWDIQVAAAAARLPEATSLARPSIGLMFTDAAVLLLLDQSGSMKGKPLAWAAAELRMLADFFASAGAAVEVAGFSTAGWRGGLARQKWIADKRPKRPGRLCALLHVVYRAFDEAQWNDEDWRAMLYPNLLRENVDGEAILWAEQELLKRAELRKILIVVSDGAPVDDSTLMENGELYLWRHLGNVVSKVEERGDIELMAIGVDYRVDEIYSRSATIAVDDDLIKKTTELVDQPRNRSKSVTVNQPI